MPSSNAKAILKQKNRKNKQKKEKFGSAGVVSCDDYLADPEGNAGKTVELYNADFEHGTVRITTPGLFRLMEDVSFNPQRPTMNADGTLPNPRLDGKDWWPRLGQENEELYFYTDGSGRLREPFTLGFFAAITVEAPDVIIDLNGFTLKQHEEHATMQRFYANIELAAAPFIDNAGPANFIDGELIAAENCIIENGTLGRSSHHAVHGNNVKGLIMQDVIMKDCEVAAVSLNGSRDINIIDCEDRGRKPEPNGVMMFGTWSALRFAKFIANSIVNLPGLVGAANLQTAIDNACVAEKRMFDDMMTQGCIIAAGLGAPDAIFKNTEKVTDGPIYSFLMKGNSGPAVNAFAEELPTTFTGQNFYVSNYIAKDSIGNTLEVPALTKSDGTGVTVDTAGAVFQVLNTYIDDDGAEQGMRDTTTGVYNGTVLSDLQIALAETKRDNPAFATMFGTLSIGEELINWAKDGTGKRLIDSADGKSLILKEADGVTDVPDTNGNPATLLDKIFGGDSMHHISKGLNLFRIDQMDGVLLENVRLENGTADGALGQGEYIGGEVGDGHRAAKQLGYLGNESHGVRISACRNVLLDDVKVVGLKAKTGRSVAFEVQGESEDVLLQNCSAEGVVAGYGLGTGDKTAAELKNLAGYPNHAPKAKGLKVAGKAKDVGYDLLDVLPVQSLPGLKEPEEEIDLKAQRRGGENKRRSSRNLKEE